MPAPPAAFTIAVAGGSGSGKSCLTRAALARLGDDGALLDHDSYYRCRAAAPPAERAAVNYDHPDSLENDLLVRHVAALRRGRPIDKPRYCFATHTRLREVVRVAPRALVFVEGILVMALPELQRAFDFRVFVDAPGDVRLARRIERDVRERGRTRDSVLDQWRRQVAPMHERFVEPSRAHADLVLSGLDDPEHNAATLLMALARRRVQAAGAGGSARG